MTIPVDKSPADANEVVEAWKVIIRREHWHAVLRGLGPAQGPPARIRFHRGASRRGREGPVGTGEDVMA